MRPPILTPNANLPPGRKRLQRIAQLMRSADIQSKNVDCYDNAIAEYFNKGCYLHFTHRDDPAIRTCLFFAFLKYNSLLDICLSHAPTSTPGIFPSIEPPISGNGAIQLEKNRPTLRKNARPNDLSYVCGQLLSKSI